MNVFNRIFTILTIIALIVIGVATLVSPATVLAFLQNTANLIRQNVFGTMPDFARLAVRILAAVIFALIMLGLLWLELRRSSARTIEVGRYTGGTTIRIGTDAVEDKVREAVDGLGGIIGTRVKATSRNKAVDLMLDVLATKEVDLVTKAEEVANITRYIVQDQLGLKLHGKPQVTIKAKAGKAKKPTTVMPPPAIPVEPQPQRPALEDNPPIRERIKSGQMPIQEQAESLPEIVKDALPPTQSKLDEPR
jgi:hypothetical protein